MLEFRVQQLEAGVIKVLGGNDHPLSQKVHEVFTSPFVTDPFCGLMTEYMQKQFYKDEFNFVVSVYPACKYWCMLTGSHITCDTKTHLVVGTSGEKTWT